MAKNYLEAGPLLKIATLVFLAAGAAEVGVAAANQIDVFKANADKISATVALQKETPEQIAARTARINKDNKDTQDSGTLGVVLFIAGGLALVANNVISSPSNPRDRRANRRIS